MDDGPPNRGRQWAVVAARMKDGALQRLECSSDSSDDDGTDDDEGFGDEQAADFKATSTFLRSTSLNRALSISAPSSIGFNTNSRTSIGSGDQAMGVSPGGWPSPGVDESVQDNGSPPRRHHRACRAHFRSNGILLTPIDAGRCTPRMSDAPYASELSPSSLLKGTPENTSRALPCAVSFPSVLPSASPTAPDTPQYGQENGPEQPERAPFHGSQSPFSPSSSPEGAHPNGKPHGEPKEGSSPTSSVAKGDQTKERVHTIVSTVTCDPCSPVKSGRSVDGNSSVGLTARSTEEEVVKEPSSTGEARLVAERDVRCLIGVFSFMAGLLVPANLSWLLLLASFSASVNILTRLSPRLRLAAQEGRLMPVFCNPLGAVEGRQETNPTATAALSHESMTTSERSAKVPLLHSLSTLSTLSLQCNRHEAGVRSASPLLGAGPLGKNGSRRSLFAVMSQRLGESFKNMTVERSCDPLEGARDADGATIQGGDDERADEASRGLNCGADADSQGSSRGIEMRRGDLHWQVVSSLSADQRAFVASAGGEEKIRLVQQCLAYANEDILQARKVCAKFCDFRMGNRWSMTLSPTELEVPLRSRTHTLASGRDNVGRGILTFSPANMDIPKCSAASYQKMLCYVLQEVLKDKELQTKGLLLLVDARHVGFGTLKHFKMADYKRGLGMLSGAFPAKLKAIRILHPTRALRVALAIGMPLMSSKMQARLQVVSDEAALDGSFVNSVADAAVVPVELGIGGTWEGSVAFWDNWVGDRVRAAM